MHHLLPEAEIAL